jgi:5-hydroxyisourate hydrolase-like protein (transthyretin family)
MKKLEDITYRHELIERYLDADTSVEEEQALADFYRHCENKDLTDEDLDIRNLMLGMENYTPNIHQVEKEDKQSDMKEMSLATSKTHETRWVRLSALLLATAMLAGLIFLLFPIKDYFSSSSEQQPGFTNLVSTEQVVRSQPSSEDEDGNLNAYEKMERADSIFLAATQDIVTPQEMKTSKIALAKRKNIAGRSEKHAGKTSVNTEKTSSETERSIHEDFNQIYEVASAALPSAEQLTINRQGNNIVISTLDNDGNMQHYTINITETQDGSYQLLPLAQLNE